MDGMMPTYFTFSDPNQQFFDNNGAPLAGGMLYTYEAYTSNPQVTYSDVNGNVANTNPIILDSAGRCTVFLTNLPYSMVLKDQYGATIENISFVQAESAVFVNSIKNGTGSDIGVKQPYGNTVQRNLNQFISAFPSILDFGATPDGVADCSTAISSANGASRPVYYPPGVYVVNQPVTISHSIIGAGPDKTIFLVTGGSISVGAWYLRWSGVGFKTGVNNKAIITCNQSYWTLENTRADTLSAATGTNFIKWDCTANSVYFNRVVGFKTNAFDIPFNIVGPTGGSTYQSFNANTIGLSYSDDCQQSATANVQFSGDHLVAVDNVINGYYESSGAVVGASCEPHSVSGSLNSVSSAGNDDDKDADKNQEQRDTRKGLHGVLHALSIGQSASPVK